MILKIIIFFLKLKNKMPIKKDLSFEESLKKLEEIVDILESGEINLEKSVKLYEEGMILKKNCDDKLKKIEAQIKKIKIENGKIKKEDLN